MKKVLLSNVISAIEAMERPLDFKLTNLMCINGLSVTNAVSQYPRSCNTPLENAQRWTGKNTFHFLLLNDDNMIGEHQETRIEMPDMCPFEKKEKEVFFRLPTFFFRDKKKNSKEQLLFSFLCIIMQKKISERSKKIVLKIYLTFFEKKKISNEQLFFSFLCFIMQSTFLKKKKIKNFRIAPNYFFAL